MEMSEWKIHGRGMIRILVERRDHIVTLYYGRILHMQTLRMHT